MGAREKVGKSLEDEVLAWAPGTRPGTLERKDWL
jgi:hypothetical protein